jgi:hypothetical protein
MIDASDFSLLSAPKDAASKKKQKQWAGFSSFQKEQLRKTHPDKDKDGVPDMWDCQPSNPFRQDRFSETQIAEIKGLGTIEAGDFIGKGYYGAVFGLKADTPEKQKIADKYVVKVGIDAFAGALSFMNPIVAENIESKTPGARHSRLPEKDKKLLQTWQKVEGHKPTLERLHKARAKGEKRMDAISEFRDYKDKGFENLSIMSPVMPTIVDMGEFRTFGMVKPKMDVIGERLHTVKNKAKITPEILEETRVGTKELTDAGLGIWDYYQIGVGEQDGKKRVWAFDTDIARPDAFAAQSNKNMWEGFLNAVKSEKPQMEVIQEDLITKAPPEDLTKVAQFYEKQNGVPEIWKLEHAYADNVAYTTILRFSQLPIKGVVLRSGNHITTKSGQVMVRLHQGENGTEYVISFTVGREPLFRTYYKSAYDAMRLAFSIMREINAVKEPFESMKKVEAVVNKTAMDVFASVGNKKEGVSKPVWGVQWGHWKVKFSDRDNNLLQMSYDDKWQLLVYREKSKWEVVLSGNGLNIKGNFPNEGKALEAAKTVSKLTIFQNLAASDEAVTAAVERILQPTSSNSKKNAVHGYNWGGWKLVEDNSVAFMVRKNQSQTNYFEIEYEFKNKRFTLWHYRNNSPNILGWREYKYHKDAFAVMHQIAMNIEQGMIPEDDVDIRRVEEIVLQNAKEASSRKYSSSKNMAKGYDWGDWNIAENYNKRLKINWNRRVDAGFLEFTISSNIVQLDLKINNAKNKVDDRLFDKTFKDHPTALAAVHKVVSFINEEDAGGSAAELDAVVGMLTRLHARNPGMKTQTASQENARPVSSSIKTINGNDRAAINSFLMR